MDYTRPSWLELEAGIWKRKHFEESWKRTWKHLIFEEPEAEAFFIKHGASTSSNLALYLLWHQDIETILITSYFHYGYR